jgi:hypothetical protein
MVASTRIPSSDDGRTNRLEAAVAPVDQAAFGVEGPDAVVPVRRDAVDELRHRSPIANRHRLQHVVAQP